jgi:hypothetical protein
MVTPEVVLTRSARLINEQYFAGEADEDAIVAGLMATTVRLVADEQNMSSIGGQAALVTTFQLIARLGLGVELIVPDVELVTEVPPLRRPTLRAALLELGEDLLPQQTVRAFELSEDVTFVFGDSEYETGLRVQVMDLGCRIVKAGSASSRVESGCPLGGLAAGTAAAAIALDAALPRIEEATRMRRTTRPRPSVGPPVDIDLGLIFPSLEEGLLGCPRFDVVSGGAVTNALVNVFHWLAPLVPDMFVLDDDDVDWHNLNRCVQFRASDVMTAKTDALQKTSTGLLTIKGTRGRFAATGEQLMADHVAVGVDDIRARWWVQESWPSHLYVAATSNYEAVVTTHHPGQACAGCAHPEAAAPRSEIPTISFVSYWAGLIQACALLADLSGESDARRITVYLFALGERTWWTASRLTPVRGCAIACPASRALSRESQFGRSGAA